MAVSDGKTTAIEHSEPITIDASASSSSPTHSAPQVVHTKGAGAGNGYAQEDSLTSGTLRLRLLKSNDILRSLPFQVLVLICCS